MAQNTLPIPIPREENVRANSLEVAPQQTSGSRGTPEMNFDYLNAIQNTAQTKLGELQVSMFDQMDNMSDVLNRVHTTARQTFQKKRDSDLLFNEQANQLAARSDAIKQKVMEAAADPFNELKAVFTDTPSMAEWAAKHNAVQNEMNLLKRRYSSVNAEYNFELGEVQNELIFAQQKLGLTGQQTTQIAKFAQALTTEITARSALFTQQLDTMGTRAELVAEFDDPNGTIPKDLVRRRIEVLDLAQAELSKRRSAKGKTQAEQYRVFLDILDKYPELLPTNAAEQAIAENKPVHIPQLDFSIQPRQAEIIVAKQAEARVAAAKSLATITQNQLQGEQAVGQVSGMLSRFAGPGQSIYSRDDSGRVVGFDPEAIPADLQQDVAAFEDAKRLRDAVTYMLSQEGVLEGPARDQQMLVQSEANRMLQESRDKIAKKIREDVGERYQGKEAKKAAGDWAEFQVVKSDMGASELLAEGATSVLAGDESSMANRHGFGWGNGMALFGSELNRQIKELSGAGDFEFENEDGEPDSKALLKLVLQGNAQAGRLQQIATSNALGQVDADGHNAIKRAVLSDWYDIALNSAIKVLKERHASEPETVKLLDSLRLGEIGLHPMLSNFRDEDGNELDTANVLFAMIALKEQKLREAGALGESSNLVDELKGLLLGDQTEANGPTLYQLPSVVALTRTTTPEAGAMNLFLFQNNARSEFERGMVNMVRQVPTDDLSLSMEIARRQAQLDDPAYREQIGSHAVATELRDINQLRKQQGGQSLTSTLEIIKQQLNVGQ